MKRHRVQLPEKTHLPTVMGMAIVVFNSVLPNLNNIRKESGGNGVAALLYRAADTVA